MIHLSTAGGPLVPMPRILLLHSTLQLQFNKSSPSPTTLSPLLLAAAAILSLPITEHPIPSSAPSRTTVNLHHHEPVSYPGRSGRGRQRISY